MATTGIDTVYQFVIDDTGRPDKEEIIWRRIHRSILNHHRMDQWKDDFIEKIYNFGIPNTAAANQPPITGANALFMNTFGGANPTLNVQVLDIDDLKRFRKVGYLRKWQTVNNYGLPIIDPITGRQGTVANGDLLEANADSMFDGYGFDKQDVYYRSGNEIKVNSSTPLNQLYLGYFSDPLTVQGCTTLEEFHQYDSWIANDFPSLIASDVKKKIFSDIGKTDEMKTAQDEYVQVLATLTANKVMTSTRKG